MITLNVAFNAKTVLSARATGIGSASMALSEWKLGRASPWSETLAQPGTVLVFV
jgi:hypothetical protein